jgi:hypothetical protein
VLNWERCDVLWYETTSNDVKGDERCKRRGKKRRTERSPIAQLTKEQNRNDKARAVNTADCLQEININSL